MEVIYNNMGILDLTAGFIAALLFGVLACNWMIAIVKQSKISYFAVYCILVGLTSCIVAWI
jgi:undecaprenyl-diphosphatase